MGRDCASERVLIALAEGRPEDPGRGAANGGNWQAFGGKTGAGRVPSLISARAAASTLERGSFAHCPPWREGALGGTPFRRAFAARFLLRHN